MPVYKNQVSCCFKLFYVGTSVSLRLVWCFLVAFCLHSAECWCQCLALLAVGSGDTLHHLPSYLLEPSLRATRAEHLPPLTLGLSRARNAELAAVDGKIEHSGCYDVWRLSLAECGVETVLQQGPRYSSHMTLAPQLLIYPPR